MDDPRDRPDVIDDPLPDIQAPPPPTADQLELPDDEPGEPEPRPIDDLPVPEAGEVRM